MKLSFNPVKKRPLAGTLHRIQRTIATATCVSIFAATQVFAENSSDVAFDINVPMGWAVVSGYDVKTTTGGAGGEIVTAATEAELKAYLEDDDTPRIVRVKGTIKGSGEIEVSDNKTIIGVSDDAKIDGNHLKARRASNIIIRNLEITGGEDGISALRSNHIWIDHVYVHKTDDGLIDLTRETDMYTVSWTEFADQHKTMLLNSSSKNPDDRGKINGTLHHNFFNKTVSRNPRAGYGKIHIFNDYNLENRIGIAFHSESRLLAENNYFKDGRNSIRQMYRDQEKYIPEELGDAKAVGNILDNSSGDDSTGIAFEPTDYYLYDFLLEDAKEVPTSVLENVGPAVAYSEIGLMPIPGQGAIEISDTKLSWLTGTYAPVSYVLYFGTSKNPPEITKTTATSYDVETLKSGQIYYWRVDQLTEEGTVEGKLWTFKAK